ncbi:MAG: DUF4331 domain-containing protein, partial [Proteobacteria bacterium]|nr:DUF4331 domain-containing protein [Pseudomonadota bacterium]
MKRTALALAVLTMFAGSTAMASSHREAPEITAHPKVDSTDFYMFRSYEPGREGFVTLIANYQPDQSPAGGPNFYMMEEEAVYSIHIDNTHDGMADQIFQFRFNNTSKSTALPIGGKQVKIPLLYSNQIAGVNPPELNVRETYTLQMVRGDSRTGTRASVTNVAGSAAEFD